MDTSLTIFDYDYLKMHFFLLPDKIMSWGQIYYSVTSTDHNWNNHRIIKIEAGMHYHCKIGRKDAFHMWKILEDSEGQLATPEKMT